MTHRDGLASAIYLATQHLISEIQLKRARVASTTNSLFVLLMAAPRDAYKSSGGLPHQSCDRLFAAFSLSSTLSIWINLYRPEPHCIVVAQLSFHVGQVPAVENKPWGDTAAGKTPVQLEKET